MTPPIAASPIRVAIIDDDSGLVTVLDRRFAALRRERQVFPYAVGADQLAGMRLHAVLVNPEITGLDYLEQLAIALPGPALLVCTGTAPVADRVRGLRGGADDWITKPCHPEELVARIQAVLRRRRAGELAVDDSPLVAGELEIRPDLFDAYVRGVAASLSRKEYELLRQLASAEGRVLEREDIYQRVWGYTMARGDRSVDGSSASSARSSSSSRPVGAMCIPTSGWATGSRPCAASPLAPNSRRRRVPRASRPAPSRRRITRRTLRGPCP
jgi:DNA-binding response OmpR family regulator